MASPAIADRVALVGGPSLQVPPRHLVGSFAALLLNQLDTFDMSEWLNLFLNMLSLLAR
jgi:hypothetical protein